MVKDGELKEIEVEHRLVHSVYGFFNSMASNEALLSRTNGEERPFCLTRSFFAGS
jgi:alpha-glucosidase (family GH31 glycosyl hydrolase)